MTPDTQLLGPYVELSRPDWAELAEQAQTSLDAATLERVRGLDDPTSMLDVREVYLPLTRLLSRYFWHTSELHRSTNDFLQLDVGRTPFVIGDRRLGGGRQVDHRPAAARAAGRLAGAPAGLPGHHRRVPAAQRRAGAARPDGAQGLPGVLRPAGPAALRDGGEVRGGRGHRPGLRPPGLRHRAGRRGDRAAARHPDRRGPERAAAGPGPVRRHHRAGGQRLLRLLGLRRRRRRRGPRLVRRPGSSRCGRPPSATPARTSPATRC